MAPIMKKQTGRNNWFRNSTLATVLTAAIAVTVGTAADSHAKSLFGLYPLGEVTPVPLLSDKALPYVVPQERPELVVEAGCKFLGKGNIPQGINIPGGAVWTPCLWVFGTWRAAMQTYESVGPVGRNTELVTRLDLVANLQ